MTLLLSTDENNSTYLQNLRASTHSQVQLLDLDSLVLQDHQRLTSTSTSTTFSSGGDVHGKMRARLMWRYQNDCVITTILFPLLDKQSAEISS